MLRDANPGDAPSLTAIEAHSSANPWSAGRFDTLCSSEPAAAHKCLVAQCHGEAVGFVVLTMKLDEAEILNIAVAAAHRRQGIARGLLLRALDDIRSGGGRGCHLEVRSSNSAAQALYLGLGFAVVGSRRGYYPSHSGREDALLMTIEL